MAPRRPASPPCRRARRCSSQRLRLRRSPASGHAHALCPAIAGASSSPHLLRLTSGRCCFVAGELASASTPAAASLAPTPCLASCLQHAPLEVCVPAPSAKTSPASTCLGRGGRTASPPARASPSVRCPAAFFCRCQGHRIQGRKAAFGDPFRQVPRPVKTKTETFSSRNVFGIVKATSSSTTFCRLDRDQQVPRRRVMFIYRRLRNR